MFIASSWVKTLSCISINSSYIFSKPNVYLFSGMEVHTMDLFFLCRVDDGALPAAYDDASEVMFVPPADLDASAFGLRSISEGVADILAAGLPSF